MNKQKNKSESDYENKQEFLIFICEKDYETQMNKFKNRTKSKKGANRLAKIQRMQWEKR